MAKTSLESILKLATVIPVLVIEDVADALPLARALVKAGLPVLEITLRTGKALDCIRAIMSDVEGAVVGAGTVLNADQLEEVAGLDCAFAVSPGATPALLDAAAESPVPLLPGAATASEAMLLLERGYRVQKFFPAEPAGGVSYLSALASPLPQIRFCPTGSISPGTASAYLALPNVIAIGGSWMVPRKILAARDWASVELLSREAAQLKR
ncbi:MAG: bifunctional 4-hydroxy-2-oxoglutarate aldolase/2-dehydro-3-deoxy-phosphogluconate aldolase [Rhizobiales bacterium]|nr:bifunctional 4-hydroxy-2-oxoglutarate aldolase/2-dehydro-3-deoxy-phosphogluconate aldolase [Hyphomicrobiales bacterium]